MICGQTTRKKKHQRLLGQPLLVPSRTPNKNKQPLGKYYKNDDYNYMNYKNKKKCNDDVGWS